MATNTEFTTWHGVCEGEQECREKNQNIKFKIEIDDAHEGQQWMTKSSHFQLVHIPTRVAMWSHTDPVLPDWAFKQQEVNGNKNLKDKTTQWIVDEIVREPSTSLFSYLFLIVADQSLVQTPPRSTARRRSPESPPR